MPITRVSYNVVSGTGFSFDAIISNGARSYKMSLVGLAVMSCQARVLSLMLLYAIQLAQMIGHN